MKQVIEAIYENGSFKPITEVIITRAADIYSDLYQRGQLISDADILIAATALESNLVFCTNNQNHFSRIAGLTLSNWSNP